jgi:hypothetical protein
MEGGCGGILRRLWGEVEKEDEGGGNVEMEKVVGIWRWLRGKSGAISRNMEV